jgi:hypothetical protein
MRGQHADRGNYQVGYGKPPRNAGFQKGQSGNPRGAVFPSKAGPCLLVTFLADHAQQTMPTGVVELAGRGVIRKQWERLCCRSRRCSDALTPQLLHPCADRRKIVGGAQPGHPLAPQLADSRADHCKIVGGAGAGHLFSVQLL